MKAAETVTLELGLETVKEEFVNTLLPDLPGLKSRRRKPRHQGKGDTAYFKRLGHLLGENNYFASAGEIHARLLQLSPQLVAALPEDGTRCYPTSEMISKALKRGYLSQTSSGCYLYSYCE